MENGTETEQAANENGADASASAACLNIITMLLLEYGLPQLESSVMPNLGVVETQHQTETICTKQPRTGEAAAAGAFAALIKGRDKKTGVRMEYAKYLG